MEDDEIRQRLGELQGANFAQTAIAAALITFLQKKGLITQQEQNDACDSALSTLEKMQRTTPPEMHHIFAVARKRVEQFFPRSEQTPQQ